MKSKRILIITEYFYPEEFKINEVAIEWQKKGYDVDVITQTPTYPLGKTFDGYKNRWYSKDSYQGINIYRVKAVTGYKESLLKKLLKYFTFMFLGSIVSLKIGKKYDYVFGFDVGALTGMVPATILKKIYNKKVTLWIQDIWPDSVYAYGFKKTKILEFFLDGFVKSVYRNSDNFAVSAKGFKKRVFPYTSKEKTIEYLPNWADEFNTTLEPFSFSQEEKLHFTFAGNVGKVQNLDNIIKAFGALPKKYLDKAQLNIIGDGSFSEELQSLVTTHQYKNIVFWGRKPREEMYKYFKASDFLIVSLIEKEIFELTVPAKVQTYIASKKPIFAVINGETKDLIDENNLGITASPSNSDEIKNGLIKCIDLTKEEKDLFIQNSEALTNEVFNKNKIVDKLLNLLIKDNK